jgi:hypothetical protein
LAYGSELSSDRLAVLLGSSAPRRPATLVGDVREVSQTRMQDVAVDLVSA